MPTAKTDGKMTGPYRFGCLLNSARNPIFKRRIVVPFVQPFTKKRLGICGPNRSDCRDCPLFFHPIRTRLQWTDIIQPIAQAAPIVGRFVVLKAEEGDGNDCDQSARTQEQDFRPSPHGTRVAGRSPAFKGQSLTLLAGAAVINRAFWVALRGAGWKPALRRAVQVLACVFGAGDGLTPGCDSANALH